MNAIAKAVLILAIGAITADAQLVTVTFRVNIDSVYDYTTSSYRTIAPVSSFGSFSFNASSVSSVDYGNTTISTFGGPLGTTWAAPAALLVPGGPYSGAYGAVTDSYEFPNISDYPTNFVEQAATQANTYGITENNIAYYHIELRATDYLPAKNGDGSSDFAFTSNSLLSFYQDFAESGAPTYFNESYGVYSIENGSPVYSEGESWTDGAAQVISVTEGLPIPEPSTFPLVAVCGVTALALRARFRLLNRRWNE